MTIVVRLLLVIGGLVASSLSAYAQEATIAGTLTDETGGVLPGVTITALHQASGNTFVAVSDERGGFRVAVRVGVFRLTAELPGFATINRTVEMQVGQTAVINLQMVPSALQESVTVTGEAPLVDTTKSSLGSNIDAKQMQDLPLNGRNWMDLTMLAPGSRLNASTSDQVNPGVGTYQINLDGQQVSQWSAPGFGGAKYSRDAIAEFEFVANRFDATQGRSSGVQVNAVTKSGTNTAAGTFSGYFRDSRFVADDFILHRVLPYSDQQLSATFGGPIRKDRMHFFANYEYERQPQTFTYSSPYPRFNVDQTATQRNKLAGVRLDAQFSSQSHLSIRGAKSDLLLPLGRSGGGGANVHPSRVLTTAQHSNDLNVSVIQVLNPRMVNEFKVGYNAFYWTEKSVVKWVGGPPDRLGFGAIGAPIITLRGYTVGQGNSLTPQALHQDNYSVRNDLTYSFTERGRHDVKLGGEYLYMNFVHYLCSTCVGSIDAQGGPIPANIEDLLPVWNDVSTWNLAPLSPITRKYSQGVGDFHALTPRHVFGGWLQDDWAIARHLTLNLGLRYDIAKGLFAEHIAVLPFLQAGRPSDKNNIGPRLGFAYSMTDRTVFRGGFGRYFAEVTDQPAWSTAQAAKVFLVEVLPDGRADFAANPYNGPAPTFEQAIQLWQRGQQPRSASSGMSDPHAKVPYSWQTSIGLQRQLGTTMSVEADYVFTGTRNAQPATSRNLNLSYNPVTGANYPFQDLSRRPYPQWGTVSMRVMDLFDDYHALQTALTKRMSHNWQASATYTVSRTYQGDPAPLNPVESCKYPMTGAGACSTPFKVAPDLGGDSYWTGWQHRAVFNGIWQLAHGFQISGLYFYRNGVLAQSTYGADLRQTGGSGGRLRPDGSIVPRNNFREQPLHRVDLRLQRHFALGGRKGVDGIIETFNLFNHENYGAYVTQESSLTYGRPSQSLNIAYQPRMLQLGFRFAF